ncbi:MAG: uracil-DNA glycosylase family protein [Novosphingobium sp.]
MIAAPEEVKTRGGTNERVTMDSGRDRDWATQLAAVHAWWHDAGIDRDFVDEPQCWLERAVPNAAEAPAPAKAKPAAAGSPATAREPSARIGGERAAWPADLARFREWWLTEPSLDPAPGAHRVPPTGSAAPPLMVVVGHPEAEDRETLLGGAQGRLLDAMLAAFGWSRDAVYVASALPRPTPHPDWAALARDGLGDVLAHHVALVAPERLLVFGRGSVSALIGHDPAQGGAACLKFDTGRVSLPLIIAPTLAALLERPALKAGVWMRWLEWTGVR